MSGVWIPHEVVSLMVLHGMTLARAWREHLGLTVDDVATNLDFPPPVYQQFEDAKDLPESTCELITHALGSLPEQLDV